MVRQVKKKIHASRSFVSAGAEPPEDACGDALPTESEKVAYLDSLVQRFMTASRAITSFKLVDPEAVLIHLEMFQGWRTKIEKENRALRAQLSKSQDLMREKDAFIGQMQNSIAAIKQSVQEQLELKEDLTCQMLSSMEQLRLLAGEQEGEIARLRAMASCTSDESVQDKLRLYDDSFMEAAEECRKAEEEAERYKLALDEALQQVERLKAANLLMSAKARRDGGKR